jgi:hypothetical protein
MESRTIQLSSADIKNEKFNIHACGLDFFPPGILGGSTRHKPGILITLKVAGFKNAIITDIPTEKTGAIRWFFRRRKWITHFINHHGLSAGDSIIITRIDEKTYEVAPENGHSKDKNYDLPLIKNKTTADAKNTYSVVKLHQCPTNPCDVTRDTPLDSLNLNWNERDLPEKQRTKHVHRLHPYLGKYIPQLAEIFLRRFFSPGETVLDPFVGSGTTLVQANELGINSIGYDVSAFNVLLCRVKTAKYDLPKAHSEVMDILQKVRQITHPSKSQGSLFRKRARPRERDEQLHTKDLYLNEWFAPQSLFELLTYRNLIETGGYEYGDLLRVILSRSARSARLTTHFDLDFPKRPQRDPYWCYKHSRTCAPVEEAYKFLYRYSLDTLDRIEEFASLRTNSFVDVHHSDSRNMELRHIHGVVTSPPYVGLIDYHDQHAYSYHLFSLPKNSANEIGSPRNGSNPQAKEVYKRDIAAVLRRALSAMPSGRHLIVVAHDRAKIYDEIAHILKVKAEAIIMRHVNRRTGRRSGEFYESVFVWRKP